VTGAPVDGTELTADYWYRNLRDTVRFEPVIRALAGSGFSAFIEAGPHPVVAAAIEDTLDSCDRTATVIGSLRRDHGDLRDFTISLAHAHTTGVDIDWSSQLVDSSPKPVELPTYAFQRQRFWLDAGPVPSTTRHDDLPEVRADDPVDTLAALRRRLVEKSATEQDRILTELVSTHLAAVLGHESARAIPPRQEFKALGMDSLTAVNLRNRLGGATGLRLPVSLAFDHPTASAVAAYLRAELLDDEQADSLPEQIDRLERALAALRPDDPVRTGQLFRLRELASTLAGPQPGDPDGGLAARFESSTNDEIFRYLDVQLGGS
jgi:acyl transferase domain-containing protein